MLRQVLLAIGIVFAAMPLVGRAQVVPAVPPPDTSVGTALVNLASRSAVVFAGQVVSIHRRDGVVEILFRVDAPVMGQVGTTYTLREWAGLWPPGQWRYTVGERAMVFLHGTSQAGFSSAVDGGEGVVPLLPGTGGTPLLDVRRLSTRVQRQIGQPLPDATAGAIRLADAAELVRNWRTAGVREPSRRPLPPGAGVVPRRVASGPAALIHLSPSQRGMVHVELQQDDNAAR